MGHVIKQEKYCEECAAAFQYEDYDVENASENCPVDAGHTTRDHVILAMEDYFEAYFLPNHDSSIGNYPSRSVAQGASEKFFLTIPLDFGEMVSCEMILISVGSITDQDIDIDSQYGKIGDDKALNTESETSNVYSFTADEISELDLTPILASVEAGHHVGINITHNSIGTTIHYIAIRLRYKPNCCS